MSEERFDHVIDSRRSGKLPDLAELIRYRDLIKLFVRRTFVTQYRQTILGPGWAIIQPLITTVIFMLVFGNLAGLSPEGVPTFIFYLAGSVLWTYFSGALTSTANTFVNNAHIMGKVYFPRLVMPISTVVGQLISFAIQFVMFLGFFIYYLATGSGIEPNLWLLMTPLLILHLALLALAVGIIICALTTKYRDLLVAIRFGVTIWMYATPIAYSMDIVPESVTWLFMLNPVTPIVVMFRYAFLGVGAHCIGYLGISALSTALLMFAGLYLFGRVEKTFMDTI
mgnify:CR=1 FL=1